MIYSIPQIYTTSYHQLSADSQVPAYLHDVNYCSILGLTTVHFILWCVFICAEWRMSISQPVDSSRTSFMQNIGQLLMSTLLCFLLMWWILSSSCSVSGLLEWVQETLHPKILKECLLNLYLELHNLAWFGTNPKVKILKRWVESVLS